MVVNSSNVTQFGIGFMRQNYYSSEVSSADSIRDQEQFY